MFIDLLGGIELTASAAIVVAILAAGLHATTRTRAAIVAGFSLWFSVVTLLAATEVLHETGLSAQAGLGATILLPVVGMAAATLSSDKVRRALLAIPVSSLVAANTVRVLGISFLVLYAQGRLPAPFAPLAGWGDILVGSAAPLVAWLVAARGAGARSALVLWNTLGLADLILAVALGAASSPGPLQLIVASPDSGIMTTLPWLLIPGFLVPTLVWTHLAIFFRLRAGLEVGTPVTRRSTAAAAQ
jgi:hypothetical protein